MQSFYGTLAEWLGIGLQNRVQRFDSAGYLLKIRLLVGFFLKTQGGCNAHLIRYADFQRVIKFNPPGVEFGNCLILRQTNQVCVAPFSLALA